MAVNLSMLAGAGAQFFNNNGVILSGGLVYTYAAGTTTPQTSYTTSSGSTAHTNPIVLDSAGRVASGGEIWLTDAVAYKFVLKTSTGTTIGTYDNVTGNASGIYAAFAASSGSSLVGFIQAGTGAVATTVQTKLRESVSVKDFGAVGDGVTDDAAAIQAADDACLSAGKSLYFPGGTYKCLTGITKRSVNWCGDGQRTSTLAYYGNNVFINATGTNPNRINFTMSDIGLDGANGGIAARGITLGWNQRSTPIMQNVYIANFGHYGIHFNDQNWILVFDNVFVATCGSSTNDSSGIYKDAAIDVSTWNGITFNSLVVEGCGNASSIAGGMYLLTTTVTRGVYFNNCLFEDNLGSNEILVKNVLDLQFNNLYIERTNVAGQVYGVNLVGCQGQFNGGYISGEGSINLVGVYLDTSIIEFNSVNIPSWTTASIQSFTSKVYTASNINNSFTSTTFAIGNAAAQWFGDYAPRVSANKNGTNQTGVVSNSFTKVTFGTVKYDLTNAFSGSTFTPQSIGTYQINASVTWTTSLDTDQLSIAIYVNGVAYKSVIDRTSGNGDKSVQVNAQVDISNVTDTIDIWVRQTSGSDKIISGNVDLTYFMASLIGRAS